jgi:hypothetical protein
MREELQEREVISHSIEQENLGGFEGKMLPNVLNSRLLNERGRSCPIGKIWRMT